MPRPARKKGDIERSALELFVEKGIDGTSIRDIAQRAGVTEGALYRHHPSKDSLVGALFRAAFASFSERLHAAQATAGSSSDRIRAMVRAFYQQYDEDPYQFEYVVRTRHSLLDEARMREKENPAAIIERVIAEGMKAGEFPRQDTALATSLLMGLVMEAPVARKFGRLKGKLVTYTDVAANACVMLLKAGAFDASAKG
jgi:AcrR family transcriptional regulator